VRTVYRPVDPGLAARIFRQMGQPYDPQAISPKQSFYLNGWDDGEGEEDVGRERGGQKVTKKRAACNNSKDGMGDSDEQDDRRHRIIYSRDDQRFYLIDNKDGSLVKSWEGRSGFVPGFNEKGEPHESLPPGRYTVTAEVSKEGFKDKNGRPDHAYGTFYITTGDPRGRDAHGGGSGLADPFAPRQGWADTQGCLRMQNEDGEDLSRYIMQ